MSVMICPLRWEDSIMITLFCLPIGGFFRNKNISNNNKHMKKNISKRKLRNSIESLPKQDLVERIYHWLENGENERENSSYSEDSDDSLCNDSDQDLEIRNKPQSFQNLHGCQMKEGNLQGCLRQRAAVHEFIKIYHNKIWIPQTTLV